MKLAQDPSKDPGVIQMNASVPDVQAIQMSQEESKKFRVGVHRGLADQLRADLRHFGKRSPLRAGLAKHAAGIPESEGRPFARHRPCDNSRHCRSEIRPQCQETVIPVQKSERPLSKALVTPGVQLQVFDRRGSDFSVPPLRKRFCQCCEQAPSRPSSYEPQRSHGTSQGLDHGIGAPRHQDFALRLEDGSIFFITGNERNGFLDGYRKEWLKVQVGLAFLRRFVVTRYGCDSPELPP